MFCDAHGNDRLGTRNVRQHGNPHATARGERTRGRGGTRRIISNRVYDTERAKLVGHSSDGEPAASLYRKKTGEYFLHLRDADQKNGIFPMVYEEARDWAREELDQEAYDLEFGEVRENGKKTYLHIYIRSDTAARIKRAAAERGMEPGDLVEDAMRHYLAVARSEEGEDDGRENEV